MARCAAPVRAATQTSTWLGASSILWSDQTNWSPGNTFPNNGNAGISHFQVVVPAVSTEPEVDVRVTVDSMTIDPGASLAIQGGQSLTAGVGGITDNGTLGFDFNSNSASATLTIVKTLDGTGSLTLGGNSALLAGNFTQAATHTIIGTGTITATLINNGTVNCGDFSGLTFLNANVTNNGLMENTGTGSGSLQINNTTITQGSSGTIGGGGGVGLYGANISGGTLNGEVEVFTDSTLANLTNASDIVMGGSTNANVKGNLVNNGRIDIGADLSTMTFSGGTLSGTGTLTLNGNFGAATLAGSLTQAAGHTIDGAGAIYANLTNNGLIIADSVSPQPNILYFVADTLVNTSTIETSGGALTFGNGIVVNNTGGTIIDNSTLTLAGATISGGTFTTSAGRFLEAGGANTIQDLTNNAAFSIDSNATVNVTGTLVDNGGITANQSTLSFSGGTLSGTGTLVLNTPFSTPATLAGSLTQSSGHAITGVGTISAAIINNGLIDANQTTGTLTISGRLTGTGTLAIETDCFFTIAPGTGACTVGTLSLGIFQYPHGPHLDITNNSLFVDYGSNPDPIARIVTMIEDGYFEGWTGPGIISSTAQSDPRYAIGYADSADPGNPAVLASGQLEIKYTLLGDADLNGIVNGIDFGILAANFNHGVGNWDQGNFNYDGVVNGVDFTLLAANFNKGSNGASVGLPAYDDPALVAFAQANGLMADIPEPASMVIMTIAEVAILNRRRRRPFKS
jgi:hypothetical protein